MASRANIEYLKAVKMFEKKTKEITPSIYASFCKVLLDRGMDVEEVVEIFQQTQEVWNESLAVDKNMIEWVEEQTGINLCSDSTDKTDDSEYEEVFRIGG